jgi:hypothetical protein
MIEPGCYPDESYALMQHRALMAKKLQTEDASLSMPDQHKERSFLEKPKIRLVEKLVR